jgi:hypothetical protein
VAVEDPEATHEFAGLGVATIFYPGFLRAALLAHACLDLAAFRAACSALVRGRPADPDLAGAAGAAARARASATRASSVEADPARGNPVTLLGVFAGAADAPTMVVNPGPGRALADAVGLLVLTGQDA